MDEKWQTQTVDAQRTQNATRSAIGGVSGGKRAARTNNLLANERDTSLPHARSLSCTRTHSRFSLYSPHPHPLPLLSKKASSTTINTHTQQKKTDSFLTHAHSLSHLLCSKSLCCMNFSALQSTWLRRPVCCLQDTPQLTHHTKQCLRKSV